MGWLKQRNSNESRCEPRKLCVWNLLEDLGTNYLAFCYCVRVYLYFEKVRKKKKKEQEKVRF